MARKSRDLELSLDPVPPAADATATTPSAANVHANASASASTPPTPPAPLELVVQAGKTRKVHFDGSPVVDPTPEPEAQATPLPARRSPPRTAPLREGSWPSPSSSYGSSYASYGSTSSYPSYGAGSGSDAVRNTLYRTDNGGEVVAYEANGRRSLRLADRTSDGRVTERPFESRMVDSVVKGVQLEERATVQETVTEYIEERQVIREAVPASVTTETTTTTTTETRSRPKRKGWFRRHKPGEDSGQDYQPVEPTEAPVAAEAESDSTLESSTTTTTVRTTSTDQGAWDPGHSSNIVTAPVATPSAVTRTHYTDYAGDVHPVIELEGIGPTIASRMVANGVFTTARLCFEDAEELARKIDVEPHQVQQWQSMAQLIKVKGIGKQGAEVLARCGVTGIDDLKSRDPKALAERIELFLASHKGTTGQPITAKRLQTWQQAAKKLRKVRQSVPAN